jgi:hypothetical protein
VGLGAGPDILVKRIREHCNNRDRLSSTAYSETSVTDNSKQKDKKWLTFVACLVKKTAAFQGT